MKQTIKNYTVSSSSNTITLTDFSTLVLERLLLITDVTSGAFLYELGATTGVTVSGNVITFASLTVSNSDHLNIIYDCQSGDPTYDTPPATATQPVSGTVSAGVPALGQMPAANSLPIVGPSDIDIQTNDGDTQNLLAIIASAMQAIASTRGVLADLRVTPTGTVTTSGVISSGTITNVSQIGAVPANSVVQDWENQTYTSSFSVNVTRP